MSNRPEVITLALDRERHDTQRAALTELATRLDLGGNMSALARWLADAFIAIPEETTLLLMALADRADGGDAWDTLQLLRDLLPPITLSAQDVATMDDALALAATLAAEAAALRAQLAAGAGRRERGGR